MAQCVELTEESDARARAFAVLQDVVRTMYNPKFIAELFRGQDVYSMQSTRQIFDRLAHSSIMRERLFLTASSFGGFLKKKR